MTLLGRGTQLIGGTLTHRLSREDVDRVLVDGFFPVVGRGRDARPPAPRRACRSSACPYAADAAVTRHLARFLSRQARRGPSARPRPARRGRPGLPDARAVQRRRDEGGRRCATGSSTVLNALAAEEGSSRSADVLDAADLDLAVARGAAYYGLARRGRGIRIRGGAPRSYYVGIESAMPAVPGVPAPLKALCVVPFGMEEGTEAEIRSASSGWSWASRRSSASSAPPCGKAMRPAALIEDWGDDLEELSPLEVTLSLAGAEDAVVPVRLESRVTEVGTLELWCVTRDGRTAGSWS